MKLRWAALVVLALGTSFVGSAEAQLPPSQPEEAPATLGQNYPNPFVSETRIPFAVGEPPRCEEHGRLYRVTLRIYNILSQLVAIPVLQSGGGTVAGGEPLENVLLPCDRYVAYWDGNFLNTSREVTAGVYLYQLEVDGKAFTKRLWVRR